MWMAISCSVTVSMGDETKGVLRVMRLVTWESKDDLGGREANVAREDEEVIVGQAAVLDGVHELVKIEAIEGLVLLEHLEGALVIKDLGSVDLSHCVVCRQRKGERKLRRGTNNWRG